MPFTRTLGGPFVDQSNAVDVAAEASGFPATRTTERRIASYHGEALGETRRVTRPS